MRKLSYDEVTLTEGIFLEAKKADVRFIKSLEADRLLSGFRRSAGLDDKGCAPYGGWEDSQIGGHTMGHYLVASAQYVRKSMDGEMRERLAYIVSELHKCQTAHGNGFLFGAKLKEDEKPEDQFDHEEGKIEASAWVPWYTMHKIMSGLLACSELCDMEEALTVAKALGDWVLGRVKGWDEETHRRILHTEYGGMCDCLDELSRVTGDAAYARAAKYFDDEELLTRLSSEDKNVLSGQHANSTIPKFLGAMTRHPALSRKFWDKVVSKHAYITGGISDMEHFHEDNVLDARRTQCNCEGCCNYNMLKLTGRLYQKQENVQYLEYAEQVLYNGILGGIQVATGTTAYFTPMATGYSKTFGHEKADQNLFWCCTGTGMENYTKFEEQIYCEDENELLVNQYIDSEVNCGGLTFSQSITFGEQMQVAFTYECKRERVIRMRVPAWVTEKPVVTIDSKYDMKVRQVGKYLVIPVKGSGRGNVFFDTEVQVHHLPDEPSATCFTFGPFVLAAKLGTERVDERANAGIDVFASGVKIVGTQSASPEIVYGETHRQLLENETIQRMENAPIQTCLMRQGGDELEFVLKGTDADQKIGFSLIFVPFYKIQNERYGIYWYVK